MNVIERHRAGLALALSIVAGVGGDGLAAPPATPTTAPTVAELLATCASGDANGNKGVDAAACEWFAVPCGCKPGQVGTDRYRWCIPAAEPTVTTRLKVLAELRRVPDRAVPIDQVVPVILARLYPCRPGGDD